MCLKLTNILHVNFKITNLKASVLYFMWDKISMLYVRPFLFEIHATRDFLCLVLCLFCYKTRVSLCNIIF
jgi:hypothetical protein